MRLFLLCFTLVASPVVAADFEGVITGKSVTGEASAVLNSMTMYVSRGGVRVEASGQRPGSTGGAFQMTMLWQAADPGTTYLINPESKAYLKHDITKLKPSDTAAPTVEKLGKTTFLGRSVERVKVTMPGQSPTELWIDTSLHFPAAALTALGHEESGRNKSWQALEKAGVGGIPLKEISGSGKSGWEATSVEKKSLPASLFQVPADYHEAKDPLDLAPPGQADALKKKRDEALKNMTPEQRAKFEEMMKKYQQ
jgi:hypothetical protein